jgi:hypothetical protein
MVYFQTKDHNVGKFRRDLQGKMLAYFMAVWSILRPFGIFVFICYILWLFAIFFSCFGILYREKSGNLDFNVTFRPNASLRAIVLLHS